MEAVTSNDYDSSNLSRNFNQFGFNTYNYSQYDEKYAPRQILKYGDEYAEYGTNSVRLQNWRLSRHHQQEGIAKLEQRYARSHSQPERQHHSSHEARSKSQDPTRELTIYQIEPRHESVKQHVKFHRSTIDKGMSELTFYEIDGPPKQEKVKDCKAEQVVAQDARVGEKGEKREKINQGKNREQKVTPPVNYQLNRSKSDLSECQLPNYQKHQNNPYIDPPKYRMFDRPPKYQETPSKSELPPKYYQDPPKYSEVTRKHDEARRLQVSISTVQYSLNIRPSNFSWKKLLLWSRWDLFFCILLEWLLLQHKLIV